MDLENNTNYCTVDFPDSWMGTDEKKIITVSYGNISKLIESDFEQQGTPLVSSLTTPYELITLSSGSTLYPRESSTTSSISLGIPETNWFLNDKVKKTILFPSHEWQSWAITEACTHETEITKIRSISQFLQASQKIGRYSNYPENWDSYGGKAIDKDCIIMSSKIIKQLIALKRSISFEIPSPFIAPLSTGGIQMEWEDGERYLEISINQNPLIVDYFATDHAKGGQLSLEGTLPSLSFINELISWFVNGTAEDLSFISPEENYEEWAL